VVFSGKHNFKLNCTCYFILLKNLKPIRIRIVKISNNLVLMDGKYSEIPHCDDDKKSRLFHWSLHAQCTMHISTRLFLKLFIY
jgi:hypothetical protein